MKFVVTGLTLLVLFSCSPCKNASNTVVVHDTVIKGGNLILDSGWKVLPCKNCFPIPGTIDSMVWNPEKPMTWKFDTSKYYWVVDTTGIITNGTVQFQNPIFVSKKLPFHCPDIPHRDSIVYLYDDHRVQQLQDLLKEKDKNLKQFRADYETLKPKFWIWLIIAAGGMVIGWFTKKSKT